MSLAIHAACSPGEIRVAVWDGVSLLDYAIWRPGKPDGVGDVFRARVTARVPAMAGAFLDLGSGVSGFLPDSAGGADVTDGMRVAVRIVRAAQGGKGPRLTVCAGDEVPAGHGLLARGPGAVERFAALHPGAAIFIDDVGVAASLRSLAGRLHGVPLAFADDALAASVDALAVPRAVLPGGAVLHIHPTPALTALDVDLGGLTAERRGKTFGQQAANAAILPAIAREIRLRHLGGAILLDLGGLSIRKRQALAAPLEQALRPDPLAPRFLGFSALGLAEILRPRVFPPLHELLAGPHAAALSALRDAEAACLASPGQPPRLWLAPDLAAALAEDAVALSEFARRTGHPLAPVLDPTLPRLSWRVGSATTGG